MELKNFFAQDDQGNKLPGATCYLYQRGTESLIGTLYKANGLPLSNPFTTDNNGLAQLAAANGLYDVRVVRDDRDYRLTVQFNYVAETVGAAEFAASRAEIARDSTVLSAGVKNDIAHGLASTLNGENFSVLSSSSDEYVILYKNNAGVAVEVKRYPSTEAIDSKFRAIPVSAPMVPIVVDDSDNVAIWLEDGKLGAKGVGTAIRKDLGLESFELHDASLVPLFIDDSGKIPLWLDEGKLEAKGFGPTLSSAVESIAEQLIGNQPVDLNQLLTTFGKTLWLYKAKRALLNCGVPAQLKVMFYGDSWSDLDTIPNKMGALLAQSYPKVGYGWISALLNRMTNGVTATRTGWTLYDASNTPLPSPYGCAFDGASITTTLATATVKISDLPATKIVIYYRGGPGVFRYRVDGGAWTVAPQGAEGAHEKINIDGLADVAHVLDIDTTGNASSVTLYGFYATREASGYEILKCGRGGLAGGESLKYQAVIPQYAADLQADLLIISLGTNDYRSGDVQGYIDGLTGMIAKHREGRPDLGVIIIMPPDSNGVPAVPLTTIRDKGYHVASAAGCEFADIHSIFPVYSKSSALGLWMDTLHLNEYGADILCRHIYNNLMQ